MKTKLHGSIRAVRPAFCVLFSALLFMAARAPAQDDTVTISAADFQRLVYSAQLQTELALKPELQASVHVLLEMQRRNPNADPGALADLSRKALQFYRTNEPLYIRTSGYPDEILAAYLDALRHIPAHTNFVPANLTMLNYFMLGPAEYNFCTNYSVLDLINSANQRLFSSEGDATKCQALVDDCVARARGNAAFAAALDSLLWPETGVTLEDTAAEIIGNTNSPLHDDHTMTNLLALSQASGNGSLTVSSNQLMNLFADEMQTLWDTIHTNLAVLAQINQSQPDLLAYLTNQAAVDSNAQLLAAVQKGQPAKLACATAAVLVQSKLLTVDTDSAEAERTVTALGSIALGVSGLCAGNAGGLEGIMSGGLDVFNLFGGGQSPQEAMAAQIANIQTMIEDLSANMNYRFDRVDRSLTTLFDTMNQQFSKIDVTLGQLNGSVNDIRYSLVNVQSSLDRIEAEDFASFSAAQQDQIVGPIDNDLLYTVQYPPTRGPFPEVGYGSSGGGYQADEGLFYKYALNDANDQNASPIYSQGSLPPLEGQLANYPLDANLNYLQEYLYWNLGQTNVGTPNTIPYLANPQEWFIAAYAYLQLAGENPMFFRKDTSQRRIQDIINRGQNIANFCRRLTFSGNTITMSLWKAMETHYSDCLDNFTQQVAATEQQYANTNNFVLGAWRQWDVAAPRVMSTVTAVRRAHDVPSALPRDAATSIAAGAQHSLALTPDGKVVAWGDNTYGQISVPANATNIVAVAAGFNHNLALKADRTVVAWGWNEYGQTNVPTGLTNVMAIAAGNYHSLALKADGTVVGWGYDRYGQATGAPNPVSPYLSSGPVSVAGQTLTNVVAIAAGSSHSLALKTDGTVVAWGYNGDGETSIPAGLTNVVAIAAGGWHSLGAQGRRHGRRLGMELRPGVYHSCEFDQCGGDDGVR